jgi:hypothetical protein
VDKKTFVLKHCFPGSNNRTYKVGRWVDSAHALAAPVSWSRPCFEEAHTRSLAAIWLDHQPLDYPAVKKGSCVRNSMHAVTAHSRYRAAAWLSFLVTKSPALFAPLDCTSRSYLLEFSRL